MAFGRRWYSYSFGAPGQANPSVLNQCVCEQKWFRESMLRTLLYLQVSVSGQALVFVVRTERWSFLSRAGLLTYGAFLVAQVPPPPSIPSSCLPYHCSGISAGYQIGGGKIMVEIYRKNWKVASSMQTFDLNLASLNFHGASARRGV